MSNAPTEQVKNIVVTPATWQDHKETLQKTSTGLLDIVGWFGSTHGAAMWRKNPQFLSVFEEEQIFGFDPQIDDWDFSFIAIEAEVMSNASVLIIRLENKELQNGSLGSIAEIGMALTSAALRGQAVVVSIEDDLISTLREPGAISQFMIIQHFLEDWEEAPEVSGLLRIHRGNDLNQLANLACKASRQQMEKSHQTQVDFEAFLEKKAQRKENNSPYRVLIGGSGGPYSEIYRPIFTKKRDSLAAPYKEKGLTMVKVLSEGAIAEAWAVPYGSDVDPMAIAMATRALLEIESEYKRDADLLLVPIMAEAASKAASTEVGLLLLSALSTGQDIHIFMEPFDPIDYIRQNLAHVESAACKTEKDVRQALHNAGISYKILALAERDEVGNTFKVLYALQTDGEPTFKEVKQSLLGKTELFTAADNIRRVRALVKAHLEEMHADERFPNFFNYTSKIEV